jgi:hypothetical protein
VSDLGDLVFTIVRKEDATVVVDACPALPPLSEGRQAATRKIAAAAAKRDLVILTTSCLDVRSKRGCS